MVDGISGVQIGPGATLLARMPRSPSIWARPAVKLAIAPLVLAYGMSVGLGWSELIEVVLMIDPPGPMCASAALQTRNIAPMLTSKVMSHSSSVISSRLWNVIWWAAL